MTDVQECEQIRCNSMYGTEVPQSNRCSMHLVLLSLLGASHALSSALCSPFEQLFFSPFSPKCYTYKVSFSLWLQKIDDEREHWQRWATQYIIIGLS